MLNRRSTLKALALSPLVKAGLGFEAQAAPERPNVLFIVVDDLNCCVSPYSPLQEVHSPNFERLKGWGAMFDCAYAAVPACSPSRAATMLGMEPVSTEIFVNLQSWKDADVPPGSDSLFGHFRAQGWTTAGTGKLFHMSMEDVRESDWDAYWQPDDYRPNNYDLETDIAASADGQFDFGPSARAGASDTACTGWVIDRLRAGAFDSGGGFLALGLNRPHLPHSVPQDWFDRYPELVALPPGYWPGATDIDGNLPDLADLGPIARQRISTEIGDKLMRHGELNDYLRAYYASTSFADGQIGRVLDALEELGLRDSTYVVVTSDHGFMLGEKREFTKFELREIALRVPLFIAGPGITPRVVPEPVSLIDLYPTLCGLAGLAVPAHCEGQDLSSVLRTGAAPERLEVRSFNGSLNRSKGKFRLHSSVRTPKWRLSSYGSSAGALRTMLGWNTDEVELYDHDPDSPGYDPHEWHNVSAAHPEIVAELRGLLPPPEIYDIPVPERGGDKDEEA